MRCGYLVLVCVLLAPVRGFAQSEPARDQAELAQGAERAEAQRLWRFTLAPYLLFPFMNGSVTLKGHDVDLAIDTGDIFTHLNFALMLYFEATHPRWAIAADYLYMKLSRSGELLESDRSADVGMQQFMLETVGLYRLASWAEIGIGGRVNFIQSRLQVDAGRVLPEIDEKVGYTWFDPLLVTRFSVPLPDPWRLGVRADFGGVAVGSLYAWQVYPYAGCILHRLFQLNIAFRALGMKYERGSGDQRFVYDLITWGPELGFLFHF